MSVYPTIQNNANIYIVKCILYLYIQKYILDYANSNIQHINSRMRVFDNLEGTKVAFHMGKC